MYCFLSREAKRDWHQLSDYLSACQNDNVLSALVYPNDVNGFQKVR